LKTAAQEWLDNHSSSKKALKKELERLMETSLGPMCQTCTGIEVELTRVKRGEKLAWSDKEKEEIQDDESKSTTQSSRFATMANTHRQIFNRQADLKSVRDSKDKKDTKSSKEEQSKGGVDEGDRKEERTPATVQEILDEKIEEEAHSLVMVEDFTDGKGGWQVFFYLASRIFGTPYFYF
jgi:hypothetical protein